MAVKTKGRIEIDASVKGLRELEAARKGIDQIGETAKLTGSAIKLGLGVVAAKAIVDLGGSFVKLADEVGEFQKLSSVFTGDLEGLREATRGLVKDTDLMRGSLKLQTLGVKISDKEYKKVIRSLDRLAPLMGTTMTSALGDFTTAVARGSKQIADNFGVVVNLESAYEKYAAQLGKTAKQLTETEKKLATQRDIIEQVIKKGEKLPPVMETVSDAFKQIGVAATNSKNSIAKFLATQPALKTFFSDVAKFARRMARDLEGSLAIISDPGFGPKSLSDLGPAGVLKSNAFNRNRLATRIGKVRDRRDSLKARIGKLAPDDTERLRLVPELKKMNKTVDRLDADFDKLTGKAQAAGEGLGMFTKELRADARGLVQLLVSPLLGTGGKKPPKLPPKPPPSGRKRKKPSLVDFSAREEAFGESEFKREFGLQGSEDVAGLSAATRGEKFDAETARDAERQRKEQQRQLEERARSAQSKATSSGGIIGDLFGNTLPKDAESLRLVTEQMEAFNSVMADAGPIVEFGSSLFDGFGQAIGAGLGALIDGTEPFDKALLRMTKSILKNLAIQNAILGIKELALGFGSLFLNQAEAAGHFTSAGLHFAVAALAGGASAAIPSQSKGPSAAGGGRNADKPGTASPSSPTSSKDRSPIIVNVKFDQADPAQNRLARRELREDLEGAAA